MGECENNDCRVSKGVHDCLTFGTGKLDFYGFWEEPCYHCARKHEEKNPLDGPCWPHTPEQLEDMGFKN